MSTNRNLKKSFTFIRNPEFISDDRKYFDPSMSDAGL